MVSQRTRNLVAGLIAFVVAIAAVIVRRTYDLGLVASLSILAILTALLLWQLRNRSPYRETKSALHLNSKQQEAPLMRPKTQHVFTGLAIALLFMTGLIDPVYSAAIGAALLVAYVTVAYRQSKAAKSAR